jgi:glycosyltransferase involved in cell wall biosynthesis
MPISILVASTLFPNPVQQSHGIFVANRLENLVATGQVEAQVVAPVPWLPPLVEHPSLGRLQLVPSRTVRNGISVEHPRYLVVPKIGMTLTPHTLYRAFRKSFLRLSAEGRRFDLIDAHYFYPDGVAAVWLAREFGLPVVVTARGTDINLIPKFATPRRLIIDAATQADGLVAVCQALKDEMVALGIAAERVRVLRNGVDLQRYRPVDRAVAQRGLSVTRRTLLSAGHLIERKGHHHVIQALARLPETDLLIAGAGPDRASLESLAARLGLNARVRFLSNLDQDRLREAYNAVDALVLASSREGMANVLLEAMACGTPVVASAVWGTPELVAAPEAGVLMPTPDADGVVAGVEQLFAALPDRAATRRYAEQFSWQATTDGQLALFRDILARRASPQPKRAA